MIISTLGRPLPGAAAGAGARAHAAGHHGPGHAQPVCYMGLDGWGEWGWLACFVESRMMTHERAHHRMTQAWESAAGPCGAEGPLVLPPPESHARLARRGY